MSGLNSKRVKQTQFESMVHAYSTDLYRYAMWLCRDQTLSEDLVQETFMRAWKAFDKLNDESAAKSWLFTILRRENARRFEKPDADLASLDSMDVDQLSSYVCNDNNSTEVFVLRRALDALPQEYKEPLILQVLGGYSCDEIADIMGIKSGAVMTRVFRARQKLRKDLEGPEELKMENGSNL